MKYAYKKIINSFLAIIFMFSSVICMLGALGDYSPSAPPSFCLDAIEVSNSGLRQTEVDDSLFFIDLSLVKVKGNFVYVYDKKDSTIKIIDKTTGSFKTLNNHYRFYNLKDFAIYENVLIMLDGQTNNFSCVLSDTFETVDFSSQENLTTKNSLKALKLISTETKDYLLLCPSDPTTGYFEIAEISLTEKSVSGTEIEKVLSLNNIQTFKIAENWNELSSYEQIFVTNIDNNLFIMFLTNNELYSFNLELSNISSQPYQTITSVSGLDPLENIQDVQPVNLNNNSNNLAIVSSNKIAFYNLDVTFGINVSANIEKLDEEILLSDFPITAVNFNDSTLAVISNDKQALKIFDLNSQTSEGFNTKTIVNEQISPYYYANNNLTYIKTVSTTELLSSPYSKNSMLIIPENTNLVIVGEGRYLSGEPIYGWQYVMYTFNNQNYYGYVDSINTNMLTETTYQKHYVTVLGYTKLYSLPSKFTDSVNTEIKVIANSSRLEVIDSICDYTSLNTSYLLVKVNGEDIGFIDKSRVLASVSVNDKIIPNATVMRNNSEIFTSTEDSKEIILYLNKGDRVKVIGKRDTVTNYTKVAFNDDEGNEYTGYIYTHNLEPDSWSMLQIIGMLLVAINVVLLIIIICIKNKVTR